MSSSLFRIILDGCLSIVGLLLVASGIHFREFCIDPGSFFFCCRRNHQGKLHQLSDFGAFGTRLANAALVDGKHFAQSIHRCSHDATILDESREEGQRREGSSKKNPCAHGFGCVCVTQVYRVLVDLHLFSNFKAGIQVPFELMAVVVVTAQFSLKRKAMVQLLRNFFHTY